MRTLSPAHGLQAAATREALRLTAARNAMAGRRQMERGLALFSGALMAVFADPAVMGTVSACFGEAFGAWMMATGWVRQERARAHLSRIV